MRRKCPKCGENAIDDEHQMCLSCGSDTPEKEVELKAKFGADFKGFNFKPDYELRKIFDDGIPNWKCKLAEAITIIAFCVAFLVINYCLARWYAPYSFILFYGIVLFFCIKGERQHSHGGVGIVGFLAFILHFSVKFYGFILKIIHPRKP